MPRPSPLSFHLLEEITDGFSKDRILGKGAYGTVYKGQRKDGEKIAIKKLHDYMTRLNDEQFEKEYLNLASLEHPNIVRLVGYCHDTQKEWTEYNGKPILAEIQHIALCFEYMCNGSLANYLQDESTGEDWHTRYAIIKGICKGLKYLHEELNPPVYHLDLKPDNILLDDKMIPKIADFGLSKLFGDELTRVTASPIGTRGYLPPEYIDKHLVSNKLDIFSLGVIIIKLMTGPEGYFQTVDMPSEEFIELTHGNWRKRLGRTSNDAIESDAKQVKACIRIALSCVEGDRRKRPTIGDIVNELDHIETLSISHALTINPGDPGVEEQVRSLTMRPFVSTESGLVDAPETESRENELLNVYSRQLRFPFFEPNKSISCPLRLSNNTAAAVAFRVLPKYPDRYIDGLLKLSGIVPKRSTCTYLVLLEKQPPANLDEFEVTLESCIAHKDIDIEGVDDNFMSGIPELTEGNKLHTETLMAAICDPAGEKMTTEPIGQRTKIICSADFLISMDAHQTKPWILAGQYDGSISIWDYETKARVLEFKIDQSPIRAITFIARKEWIVAGDHNGTIHVRSCVTADEVKKFRPHSTWITALAVHPNLPLLITSSDDNLIKLWDWEKGWMRVRTFMTDRLSYETILFNPNHDSASSITFTTVSNKGTAKIWKTSHPIPVDRYDCKSAGDVNCFDYLPQAGGGEYFVTGTRFGEAQVWDWKTQECVRRIPGLQTGHGFNVAVVDCSPGRPLLVVALQDNTVGLYNPDTSRYENIFMHSFGRIRKFVYIKAIRR